MQYTLSSLSEALKLGTMDNFRLLFVTILIISILAKPVDNGPIVCEVCLQTAMSICGGAISAGAKENLHWLLHCDINMISNVLSILVKVCAPLLGIPPFWAKCVIGSMGFVCGAALIGCGATCFLPTAWRGQAGRWKLTRKLKWTWWTIKQNTLVR